jgi:thiamine biosynthesis lipoprotein
MVLKVILMGIGWLYLCGMGAWSNAAPARAAAPAVPDAEAQEVRAMLHTTVQIRAYGAGAPAAIEAAFAEMERVNRLLNNYDNASDVSAINRHAGGEPVPVNRVTLHAIERAVHFGALSRGAFDITIGPLLALWGFDRDMPGLAAADPDHAAVCAARALVDYRAIDVAPGPQGRPHHIRLQRPGMWMDVGAFSKGFVADRAMEVLQRHGITSALIAAGGTILTAGTKPDGAAWQIGIRHPRREDSFLTKIELAGAAVSTSGDYERYYMRQNVRRAHIIDPRSGLPVNSVQAVTVIAPRGDASDALSTALFVLGQREGMDLVEQLAGVEALLVTSEGAVIVSSGWPGSP